MDRLRALLADVQAWFQGLTSRERRLVTVAGSGACAFVLFLVLIGFSASAAGYRRRTDQKLSKLREVQNLSASYREAEHNREALERQLTSSKLSLMTYLEEKGAGAGLSIPTMNQKPEVLLADGKIVESSVELTLTDITINRLVDFLSAVERGPGVVKVKYLRLEPRLSNQTLTAWATVATYQMKQ